jgi:hypothetical protein
VLDRVNRRDRFSMKKPSVVAVLIRDKRKE